MLRYTFETASDDLVIVIADGGGDEYEAYDGDGAKFRLRHPTAGHRQVNMRMNGDFGCVIWLA
ncbi:hypothetical protein ACGF5S_31885 [Nocardia nova]|uniref:hypothetical protein n=1 Tax=Nocardia nova TaxID=37330 RepID=UPI003712615A